MKLEMLKKASAAFLAGDMPLKDFKTAFDEATSGPVTNASATHFAEHMTGRPKPVKTYFIWEQGKSRYRVWRDDQPGDYFSIIPVTSDLGKIAIEEFLANLCNASPLYFSTEDPDEVHEEEKASAES